MMMMTTAGPRRLSTAAGRAVLPVLAALMMVTAGAEVAGAQSSASVLATTPWTAAFARVAGAEEVDLLAPYEMRHPPEYELRATDLARIEAADLVVYAGYERMMERLQRALGDANVSSVQITTVHTMEVIEESVTKIAEALGTEEAARRNLSEIRSFFDSWQEELESLGLGRRPVIVHRFQGALMESLGVNIAGTFGPGPLEAQQIVRLSESEAVLIVDNWHNQVAGPLTETMQGVPVVSFVNFPGHAGTRTMADVLSYNRRQLREALR